MHLTDYESLLAAWKAAPAERRVASMTRRPLLRELDRPAPPERLEVERLFALERLVWERVNEQRNGLPLNSLAGIPREQLAEAALEEVVVVAAATEIEIVKVAPPVEELLP